MKSFALLAIAGIAASIKVYGPDGEGKQHDGEHEGKGDHDMPTEEEWAEFKEACTWIDENINHDALAEEDWDGAWASIEEGATAHGVSREDADELVMGCYLADKYGAFDHPHPPKEPTEEEWEQFKGACTWIHDNIDHDAIANEDWDGAWASIEEGATEHGVSQEEAGDIIMACIMADEAGAFDDDHEGGDKPDGEKPDGPKPEDGEYAQQDGEKSAGGDESGEDGGKVPKPSKEEEEICRWMYDNIDHEAVEREDSDAAWDSIKDADEVIKHEGTQEMMEEIIFYCLAAADAGHFDHWEEHDEGCGPSREEEEICRWLYDHIDHEAVKREDADAAWDSIKDEPEIAEHEITKEQAGEALFNCLAHAEQGHFDHFEEDKEEE